MPRLANITPSYRKHRPSGQAVVTLDGKDHYLGPWNTKTSKAEYDRLIGEWLANGRRSPGRASDIAVAELIAAFWRHAEQHYRHADGTPTSEIGVFKPTLSILNRLYGTTHAADFGPLALENCRNKMIAKGWTRGSVNNQTARIRGVFKWATAKELVPPSVMQALSAVAGLRAGRSDAKESDPVRPVADEVVDATLPHLSGVVAAMVQVQRLTGARPGEVCAMKIGEIEQSPEVWTYKPATHKNAYRGHTRAIFIGPQAQAVLKPFLMKLDRMAHVFSPREAVEEMRERRAAARKTPDGYGNCVGTNLVRRPKRVIGECYDVAAYRRAITRAADLADAWEKGGKVMANDERIIPHWHPHQLRHSAASAIRRSFGIEGAQVILGHAELSATQIYAEVDSKKGKAIALAIG